MILCRGILVILLFACATARGALIYPKNPDDPAIFAVENGIAIGVYPAALDRRQHGGPRGVIRVGYQEGGKYFLINFIAVEPVVAGRRCYSELEKAGDGRAGKRFWIGAINDVAEFGEPGRFTPSFEGKPGHRSMSFAIHVEPFESGAAPLVEVSLFEEHPDRVRFRTFSSPRGEAMQQCILTATMGNQSRCRWLWLKDKPVHARDLYGDYAGSGFVFKEPYERSQLHHTSANDVVAVISPDEFEPREVWPAPGWEMWHHDGKWLAQYWIKPAGTYDDSLRCVVNGRRDYWASELPLPGGIAYENFELSGNFRDGEESWFGFTDSSPAKAYGFAYDVTPSAATSRMGAPDAGPGSHGLLNADFQNGLDGWTQSGGAASFRVHDSTLTTFGAHKQADTGRVLQSFTVPHNATALRFLMHGGCDRESLYIALWNGPRLYRKMTGDDSDMPFEVRWDLRPLRGQAVTLEIVDNATGPWGYINITKLHLLTDSDS